MFFAKMFLPYPPLARVIKFPILVSALFAVSAKAPLPIASSTAINTRDTLPASQIFQLRRSDIYVVIMDSGMVKIRLKNRDSIVTTKSYFEALPVEVRKEISANNDGIFTNIQIESAFPGGPTAWLRYLNRTFSYPREAVQNQIQGTVVVQFIVDEGGKISVVEAVAGPRDGGLREEAIRVVKRSGTWEPAIWNGYKVKSYKKQPITFSLGL